jgi:hypothetical protein
MREAAPVGAGRRPPARRYRIGKPNRLGVNLPSVDDMLDQAHRQKFGW